MPRKKKSYFVITYRDPVEDKVNTLKAAKVDDSPLGLSFIRISDFVFEHGNLVVNPDEEALEKRLENTKSLHLSIYTIASIEEVGRRQRGLSFEGDKTNLVVLPGTTGKDS